jgi:hypothetical protein
VVLVVVEVVTIQDRMDVVVVVVVGVVGVETAGTRLDSQEPTTLTARSPDTWHHPQHVLETMDTRLLAT